MAKTPLRLAIENCLQLGQAFGIEQVQAPVTQIAIVRYLTRLVRQSVLVATIVGSGPGWSKASLKRLNARYSSGSEANAWLLQEPSTRPNLGNSAAYKASKTLRDAQIYAEWQANLEKIRATKRRVGIQ